MNISKEQYENAEAIVENNMKMIKKYWVNDIPLPLYLQAAVDVVKAYETAEFDAKHAYGDAPFVYDTYTDMQSDRHLMVEASVAWGEDQLDLEDELLAERRFKASEAELNAWCGYEEPQKEYVEYDDVMKCIENLIEAVTRHSKGVE